MTLKLILGIVIGALVGGVVGYAGKCSGGTCPLACTPIGGIVVGGLIGALVASSLAPRTARFTPSAHVVEVADTEAFTRALAATPVALVDFYADWCGPCRRLKPVIHRIADTYTGRVTVISCNVDRNRELAAQYGVSGIPDVRILKSGEEAAKLVGLRGERDYTARLDELLGAGATTE
jgi:thioredoxin 1